MHFIVANGPSEPKLCRRPSPHPYTPETPLWPAGRLPHKGERASGGCRG